jgi:hypothetical protein
VGEEAFRVDAHGGGEVSAGFEFPAAVEVVEAVEDVFLCGGVAGGDGEVERAREEERGG